MAPKSAREINAARRNNPTLMAADAAHGDLCAATATLDYPDMLGERDQAAEIRAWFAAVDRDYNARVAAAREAGELDQVPARPTTPAMWPPREGDVWITRHGWTWELVGDLMVTGSGGGHRVPVEWFVGGGAALMRRDGVGTLGEVLVFGVGV